LLLFPPPFPSPLCCGSPADYHIFPDSNLIVIESEPSSIPAFCLSSREYTKNLEEVRRAKAKQEGDGPRAEEGKSLNPFENWEGAQLTKERSNSTAHVSQVLRAEDLPAHHAEEAKDELLEIEDTLNQKEGTHIKYRISSVHFRPPLLLSLSLSLSLSSLSSHGCVFLPCLLCRLLRGPDRLLLQGVLCRAV
jgi:hypothetical protein